MGEAIEAGGDLVLITGLIVCIGLLYSAKYLTVALRDLLGFSIAGVRPLGWAVDRLAGLIESGADSGIKASERTLASLFNGLTDSLELLVGVPVLLGLATKAAILYLWKLAVPAFVHNVVDPIRSKVAAAASAIAALSVTVVHNLTKAEAYADARANHAIDAAEAFATHAANVARADALRYADQAVSELRAAENQAIATATHLANSAIAAAHLAETEAVSEAEAFARRELAGAQAAFDAALAGVKGIAVRTEDELRALYGDVGLAGAAGLIASIPALALLVHTLATETGLDRSECRGKVKGICGTDASQWGGLLGGLALMAGALDLRELVAICRPLVKPAAALVRQAG